MDDKTKQLSPVQERIVDFRRAVMNRDGARIVEMLQDLKHRIGRTDGANEAQRAAAMIATADNIPAAYEKYDRQQTKAEADFRSAAEGHRQAGLEAQAEDLKYDLYPAMADVEPAPTDRKAARDARVRAAQAEINTQAALAPALDVEPKRGPKR